MGTLKFDPKDPQQFDLYDAEQALKEHRSIVHYRDKEATRKFVERVLASAEWKALGGPRKITIVWTRHDSGIATCYRTQGKVCLPGWAFNQKTVLHELAHMVTDDGHGPRFAGTALMLYRKYIGARFADEMLASYRAHGVKVKQRRFKYTPKADTVADALKNLDNILNGKKV